MEKDIATTKEEHATMNSHFICPCQGMLQRGCSHFPRRKSTFLVDSVPEMTWHPYPQHLPLPHEQIRIMVFAAEQPSCTTIKPCDWLQTWKVRLEWPRSLQLWHYHGRVHLLYVAGGTYINGQMHIWHDLVLSCRQMHNFTVC